MKTSLPATLLGLLFASISMGGDAAATAPKFTKAVPTDAVRFVFSTSPDGQARTMLFDNFIASTVGEQPAVPDLGVKTLTYVFGVESEGDACVHQDFRGFVTRQGAAHATMIVHAGGKTTVIDLQQAMAEANKNVIERTLPAQVAAAEAAAEAGFEETKTDSESSDFYARVSTLVPKGQSLQTTVILMVDRVQSAGDPQAMIIVDSIDSEVFPENNSR